MKKKRNKHAGYTDTMFYNDKIRFRGTHKGTQAALPFSLYVFFFFELIFDLKISIFFGTNSLLLNEYEIEKTFPLYTRVEN